MEKENLSKVCPKVETLKGFKERNKKGVWIFKLDAIYIYHSKIKQECFNSNWMEIDMNGTIIIKKDYAWDDSSPKFNILDILVFGTPDGVLNSITFKPKAYYAYLVHDALYQYMGYHGISREQADRIFYEILKRDEFCLKCVYYLFVRAYGCFFARK